MAADGGCETDVVRRMNERYKAWVVVEMKFCTESHLLYLMWLNC